METDTFIVFPHQQFYDVTRSTLAKYKHVMVIEEPLFFYDVHNRPIRPNKLKLAYLVASMCCYYRYLCTIHSNVDYIPFLQVSKVLSSKTRFTTWYPYDKDLVKKYPNAEYLDIESYFAMPRSKLASFHQTTMRSKVHNITHVSFWKYVRHSLGILPDVPSFDAMNRSKLPKGYLHRDKRRFVITTYDAKVREQACAYIEKHPLFHKHIGTADVQILRIYPINHIEASQSLTYFCRHHLNLFGKYQDAISKEHVHLHHSNMSAALNIGIITPMNVVREALKYRTLVPINSLEGFIRQVIGWREYCGYLYEFHYEEMKSANHFEAHNNLDASWYTASTGIAPIDNEIKKAVKYGYAHHIIRLMVFLNYMVLSEVSPAEIYKWFMEVVAIDAYDWVMLSNIQIMSHYWTRAMRKPYITKSAYVAAMSDYPKGAWCKTWDDTYTRFLHKKKDKFVGSSKIILARARTEMS